MMKKTNKAFTIVETLVAVTILMIAVAGPLVVAGKGLTSSLYARDQMIASYLAQESMEFIKNKRDNNMANSSDPGTYSDWLLELSNCIEVSPCDGSALDDASSPADKGIVATCTTTGCTYPLYAVADGYSPKNVGSGSLTPFKRAFYLKEPGADSDDPISPEATEVTAIVEVHWSLGTINNALILRSQLHRALR